MIDSPLYAGKRDGLLKFERRAGRFSRGETTARDSRQGHR
jgi:hypothetical protein